jgi:hypothetical protein
MVETPAEMARKTAGHALGAAARVLALMEKITPTTPPRAAEVMEVTVSKPFLTAYISIIPARIIGVAVDLQEHIRLNPTQVHPVKAEQAAAVLQQTQAQVRPEIQTHLTRGQRGLAPRQRQSQEAEMVVLTQVVAVVQAQMAARPIASGAVWAALE